jgi:hypothetical protein
LRRRALPSRRRAAPRSFGRNVVRHNLRLAKVSELAGKNVIDRNIANQNVLDGIVSVGTNTLTANIARHNGRLGIYTVEEAIDGRRNRASGNAEPQCIGVTCTP